MEPPAATSLLNNGTALDFVSGGRLLTFQDNRIVGNIGTGFSGTTGPQ